MGCFRKSFVISSIFLVTVATGIFFGPRLLDLNPKQKDPAYELLDSGRIETNQPLSQSPSISVKQQQSQSISGDDLLITESQEVGSSNQNIEKWDTVVVWGTLVNDFGEIVSGETVVFYSPSLKERYSMRSSVHGEFVFTDIKPATDYSVTVSPRGMYKRYTRSPINLNFTQVTYNIVLEALPVGVLRGTISDPYDRPVTGIELSIRTIEKDYWSINVVTDASGSFMVTGFPEGEFEVFSGWQQSFRATGMSFDPDADTPLSLTIDLGPYNLGGHIYSESGQAFDGANVVVIWTVQNNGIKSRSTRQVTTDSAGAFRFTELGPGTHELIVSAWGEGVFKQTVKQTVNLGIDSGELNIILNTL